jgi:hypothetical protein
MNESLKALIQVVQHILLAKYINQSFKQLGNNPGAF